MYISTKTYGHELGLSACFRQWRATDSHCSKLHGYALSFHFVFEAATLDSRNWVVDFGGLKWLKEQLAFTFDHKTLVAEDDPLLEQFLTLGRLGAADVIVLPAVGCEAFATLGYNLACRVLLRDANLAPRVRVVSCTVSEHGANSATYTGDKQ